MCEKNQSIKRVTYIDADSGEGSGHVLLGRSSVSTEHKEHVGCQVTHLASGEAMEGDKNNDSQGNSAKDECRAVEVSKSSYCSRWPLHLQVLATGNVCLIARGMDHSEQKRVQGH